MNLGKYQKLSVVITAALSFIIFFVGGLYYGVNSHNKTLECEKIIQKIGLEFGIDKNYCRFSLNHVLNANTLESVLQPKLASAQELEKEHQNRSDNYTSARFAYDEWLRISEILKVENVAKIDLIKNFVRKNQIFEATTELNIETEKMKMETIKLQSENNVKLVVLRNKIKEAQSLQIDTSVFEQAEVQLSAIEINSPETAEQYKREVQLNLDNINLLTAEIDKKVEDQNKRYTVNFPILMYHRIEEYDKTPDNQKSKIRQDLTISPDGFRQQLDWIQQNGYKTVTTGDVELAILAKDTEFFKQKLVMLTFDDGYLEHYKIAFPELSKRGLKGVFGIVTSFRGIDWNQLREMSNGGMEIVSHTVSHCALASNKFNDPRTTPLGGEYRRCSSTAFGGKNMMPAEEVRFELAESKKTLEKEFGKPVKSLIYPYGSYNQDTTDLASQAGFTISFKVGGGPNINLNKPMELSRVNVSGLEGPLEGWFKQ